jgi:hypothetical protein
MFPGNPNPFFQTPGKIVLDIQRKRMPSGQIVEIRIVELTIMENTLLRREKVREVDPSMADNTTPDAPGDIFECHVCLGLFSKDNVFRCPVCGRDYCCLGECQGEVKVSKDEQIVVCAPCAKEANTGLLKRISKKFWRLGM